MCMPDSSAMLEIARETLVRAGLGDQDVFIHGQSQQIDFPERVDVVICDHVGYFVFDYGIKGLFEEAKRRFSHSTWQGMVLTPEELIRANPTRVPRISPKGRARMTVLSYCDGRRTIREIEQAILRDHPDLFPSPGEIARFITHVLGRDTG